MRAARRVRRARILGRRFLAATPTNYPPPPPDAVPVEYDELPTFPERPSFEHFHNELRLNSQTVVFDGCPDDPHRPSSTPLYQTSTFQQPDATTFGSYDYTRSGNPTRTALEKHVAMLEGAHACFAFTSGMAALSALTRLLEVGDEMLLCDDIYGGMFRLVSKVTARQGVTHRFIDATDVDAVLEQVSPQTKLVHIEVRPSFLVVSVKLLSVHCSAC